MGDSYGNFKSFEGSLAGEKTLEFPWRPRSVQITNDGPNTLKFKFNSQETWGTLNINETISPDIIIRNVILQSSNTNYRVWGIG